MSNEAKKLLEALLPAINDIDGGCTSCIGSFIKEANLSIRKLGYEVYDANKDDPNKSWCNVCVREVEE